MGEREAFIRAICENPADDSVRLIFADWLDEHGHHNEAARVRVESLSRIQLKRRTKEGRGWWDYTSELLSGLVPKSWSAWPIPFPDELQALSDPVLAQAGKPPSVRESWVALNGNCGFSCSSPFIAVGLRYGFVSAVCAPVDRLRKTLPAIMRRQPVCHVAANIVFIELECYLRHQSWEEANNRSRVVRLRANRIPAEVWDRLTPPGWETFYNDLGRTYPDLPSAYEDLSRAFVSWGREQAGLPPLPAAEITTSMMSAIRS